jgi:hypothetical protein
MKKPKNEIILQCIDIRHSPTCFGTLKCHNQGVNHDPAEKGAQCCKQRWMDAMQGPNPLYALSREAQQTERHSDTQAT